MKILFVFKSENFLAPLGLCMVSAVARQEGHASYLCETNTEDPLKKIASLKPDIVAYSSSTGEAKHYIRLNRMIKQEFPDIFTIMGGPHPTFFPEVIDNSTLDAVCIGEGEEAFRELLRARSSGRSAEGIANIRTGNNGNTPLRHLIEDLDSLPFPDYGLFTIIPPWEGIH